MPGRRNQQGRDTSHLERWRRTCADAGRVNPMLIRQVSLHAIEFRQTTRPALKRQSLLFEPFVQNPPSYVDSSSILERGLCLSQDANKAIRFFSQEGANILRPFGLI